ncbi:MAG: class I SAM-dependent methyltransferase [Bacteroidia bacterium]
MEQDYYTNDFFTNQMPISKKSASVILPELYSIFPFKSMLDIGCGTGEWLNIASNQLGITDYLGVDGDYVNPNLLAIPKDKFKAFDLKQTLNVERNFDLVLSAEVAEHLPIEVSDVFIDSIVRHGKVILFSAAAPGQGGTYHVNEQWQDFWVKKFSNRGFLPIDFLREKLWYKKGVDWWYKQNMILFVQEDFLNQNSILKSYYNQFKKDHYKKVHPEMIFAQKNIHNSLGRFLEAPIYTCKKLFSFIFS